MYSLTISRQAVALIAGFCIAGGIFFYNYSIAGFGATILPFLFLAVLAFIATCKRYFRLPINKNLTFLFVMHLLFCFIFFWSFHMTDNLASEDVRYLLAWAANIFWWPILLVLAVFQPRLFHLSFKIGYVLLACIIVAVWLLLVFHSGDVFFLRHGGIGIKGMNVTLFRNPNQFARITLVVTSVLYFYYILSRCENEKGDRVLLGLIMFIVFIVASTLSRANVLALIVFGIMSSGFSQSGRIRSGRIFLGSLGIISSCILAAVFIPEVSERFHKAISKVIYFFSVVPVDDPVTAWGGPRVRTWLASVNVIRDNMLFGTGFSGANEILAEYGSVLIGEVRTGRVIAVHGGFLKMAIYGGLLNLAFFMIFFLLMISLTIGNFYKRRNLPNKCGAYSALVLLMMLIPINIAADCLGLSLTWMSLSFLIVNSELEVDLGILHDEISK
jgi:hypothetical protein